MINKALSTLRLAALLTSLFISTMISTPVNGQQIDFEREDQGDSHLFNYQWTDSTKRRHQISFEINNEILFNRHRNFKAYKADIAEKQILQHLKKQLNKEPIAGVSVHYDKVGKDTVIRLTSRDEQVLSEAEKTLKLRKQLALDAYFDKTYYHKFLSPSRQHAIKPDYVRFAKESADDLDPLIKALYNNIPSANNQSNIRSVFNYVLSFVQSIPYEELQSRVTSSGAGFNPPNRLIYENKGDCDSKVTLIGAILKPLFPNLEIAVVLVPGHALLAISAPFNESEDTVEIDGQFYVLAEPTGPAILPLGKIGESSRGFIASGQFSAELFE